MLEFLFPVSLVIQFPELHEGCAVSAQVPAELGLSRERRILPRADPQRQLLPA